jgi:hypothetical protein
MRTWLATFIGLIMPLAALPALAQGSHYGEGSVISPEVFVTDKDGSQVSLQALLARHPEQLTVMFIFGGGDLGSGQTGDLWCPDSFEDTSILRTLEGKYRDQGVNFIAVASAPVYHSQVLGFPADVFLDAKDASEEFARARAAFITSTLAAHESGILPIEPYFDLRLRLMLNRNEDLLPGAGFGAVEDWHGAFRAEDETQFYGVPSFWILGADGEVLAEPLRGNIYHPHGGEVRINYTFGDIDALLQDLLAAR